MSDTTAIESVAREAARRRTFAIIAHPDAGKTTLTEKLLLKGGAIQLAGAVRAKGNARRTRSDWMKIEQDRGISVATSVMTFERAGIVFNLLDTPGHEDFSEDTYRTLTAVDAAVMVLDAAKGIESQTRKLFEVCRLRDIPIVTFVNKMDREGRDPFELIDEIQQTLALDAAPVAWPVGRSTEFWGTYDILAKRLMPVDATEEDGIPVSGPDDPKIAELVGEARATALYEDILLAEAGLSAFDLDAFRQGTLTPVFFGSALRDFGVGHLLEGLSRFAPPPGAHAADPRPIEADEPRLTGFVFKVQANMDPNHRDRVAFVRLCSGEFRRGMRLKTASGKQLNIHNPMMFMAQDREIAETAYAGDVIGVSNHGQLRVGDSLSESGDIQFGGIPNFAPELLRRARVKDPMKAKHLRKALESLAEEGVTQLFTPQIGSDMIVGAVGQLQFEVMIERMTAEYSLEVFFEPAPYNVARWISSDDPKKIEEFMEKNKSASGTDLDGAPVYLAKNAWDVGYAQEKNPGIRFTATKERAI
jgi:peptide chain release factor 3